MQTEFIYDGTPEQGPVCVFVAHKFTGKERDFPTYAISSMPITAETVILAAAGERLVTNVLAACRSGAWLQQIRGHRGE